MTFAEYLEKNPFSGTNEWSQNLYRYLRKEDIPLPSFSSVDNEGKVRPKYDPEYWEYDEWVSYCGFPYSAKVETGTATYLIFTHDTLAQFFLAVIKKLANHSDAQLGIIYDDKDSYMFTKDSKTDQIQMVVFYDFFS